MTVDQIKNMSAEDIAKLLAQKDAAIEESVKTNSALQDEIESKSGGKTVHWVTVGKTKKRFFNNNTFFFKHPKTGEVKEWTVEEAKNDSDLVTALDKKGGILFTADEYEKRRKEAEPEGGENE